MLEEAFALGGGGGAVDNGGVEMRAELLELVNVTADDERLLWVPAQLGYGERSVGAIPPGSNLIFEIELLEVLTRDD